MRSRRITRSIPGLWRWRPNPLRRPSDLLEAWTGLLAVLVAAVAGPLAGIATGQTVNAALRQVVAVQHAQRHQVTAVVERVGRGAADLVDPADDGQAADHAALVVWRTADGSAHTAVVAVAGRRLPGARLPLWIDRRDRPVAAPLDTATATSNAVAAGFACAVAVAALVMGGRHFLGWRILRRRLADWESEWARVSEDWAGAEG